MRGSCEMGPMLGNENGHRDKDGKDKDQGRRPDATCAENQDRLAQKKGHRRRLHRRFASNNFPLAGASDQRQRVQRAELAIDRRSAEQI
jgi:hypothetical protein